MDDAANPTPSSSTSAVAAAAAAAQHQQLQRQLFLMQQVQAQAQAQSHPQAQQLSQQAMSRFPSNIDAHLRPLGPHRFQQPPPSQLQSQPQPQQHSQGPSPSQSQSTPQQQQTAQARGRSPEVEMALQDAMRICNPNIKTPFQSLEDAVSSYELRNCADTDKNDNFMKDPRCLLFQTSFLMSSFSLEEPNITFQDPQLLPYHVVADYEAEEDDRILDSDATGQIPSRLQQWDHNILVKIAEFTTTFEKQVLAYNIMTKKRAVGEFRSEERLMLEQALLQEEKQALLQEEKQAMMVMRAEIESREKASREAAEAKVRMVMAEQARVEAQAHSEMIGQGPLRANAAASLGEVGPSHDMAQEHGEDGWENAQRDDEDPSEDFLNDDNEPENGTSGMQEDWRRSGEFDLNSR